jgi:hypothetical protein
MAVRCPVRALAVGIQSTPWLANIHAKARESRHNPFLRHRHARATPGARLLPAGGNVCSLGVKPYYRNTISRKYEVFAMLSVDLKYMSFTTSQPLLIARVLSESGEVIEHAIVKTEEGYSYCLAPEVDEILEEHCATKEEAVEHLLRNLI